MRQNIFVLGATGNVGRELLRQVANNDTHEAGIHENPTEVIGVSNSREFAVYPNGFKADVLKQIAEGRLKIGELTGAVPDARVVTRNWVQDDILREIWEYGMEGNVVFVDATASKDEMLKFHRKVIGETRNRMVTANKNPLSLYSFGDYKYLTEEPTRYRYSATAMAGLGAVPWISERHEIGDRVHSMMASLSGTLGDITAALPDVRLSEAISAARAKGYTEPDFRDDLNGLDVMRKLVILGREAGANIGKGDIRVKPFLPERFFEIPNPDDCLEAIRNEYDDEMAAMYEQADKDGKTLKYLAAYSHPDVLERPELSVGLMPVSKTSAFGSLKGTNNRIEVVTDIYNADRPYQLEGPGAGLEVTAATIRQDLYKLLTNVVRREV